MVKIKLNVESVSIDTAINKDNEKFNRLYVNFGKIGDKMYRVGEFISFAESQIIKMQFPDFDLETIKESDFTSAIKSVEIISEETKFGVKRYLNVSFIIGYVKRINLDNDDYFLILTKYKPTVSNIVVQSKK